MGFRVAQQRVEDSCLSTQPFPLSREFINGSDAFCTSVASGMLSAMLEKLRSAAGSDGQQCQILQQVSSIEVCEGQARGPSGLCCAGIAAYCQGIFDYFMLRIRWFKHHSKGMVLRARPPLTPVSRPALAVSNELVRTQQPGFSGHFREMEGVCLHPRADPQLATALGLSQL